MKSSKTISLFVKAELKKEADLLWSRSPLLHQARSGNVSREELKVYVQNLGFLCAKTPEHLRRAKTVAARKGDDALAGFFEEKVVEEQGHDQWAEDDAKSLSQSGSESGILPTMHSLIGTIESAIEADPRDYVLYMMIAEYITVQLGPRWLSDLEVAGTAIPQELTIVSKHVELDKEHCEEDLTWLSKLFADQESTRVHLSSLIAGFCSLYSRFLNEVVLCRSSEKKTSTPVGSPGVGSSPSAL